MFKLTLDRKQIEEMLLLGLRVSGFCLEDEKVTWERKKSAGVTATVHVSANQQNLRGKNTEKKVVAMNDGVFSEEAVPSQEDDIGVVIPDQGDMDPTEVEEILRRASTRGRGSK